MRTKRVRLIAVALVAFLVVALAFGTFGRRHTADKRPNIIVICIDTLRRDHVGAYGYQRQTTPTIDALASENVLFANAYPNSNWTKPSVASLLTGLYVSQHGVKYVVTDQSDSLPVTQRLPEDATTLAEILKSQGYATIGVVENVHISAKLGFAQGFDVWDEEPYGATSVTNQLISHLGQSQEPFFAYVHYFDPHAPYYRTRFYEGEGEIQPGLQEAKATDYRWTSYTFGMDRALVGLSFLERQRLVDLYDGEIRSVDVGIARLFAELRARGQYDNSWIIITADHGENFYETGRMTHPHDCFENPQIRIPLIMKMPAWESAHSEVVADTVQLVDIVPTVMSYLDIAPQPGMMGSDLTGAILDSKPLVGRSVVAESESGIMLISSKYKFAEIPTEIGTFKFLYDESEDPLERNNLSAELPDTVRSMAASYGAIAAEATRRELVRQSADVELSQDEIERMKTLGYIN